MGLRTGVCGLVAAGDSPAVFGFDPPSVRGIRLRHSRLRLLILSGSDSESDQPAL